MGNTTPDKVQALFSSGALAIPVPLLHLYPRLEIDERQLVILLQIMRHMEKEQDFFPSVDKISRVMSLDREVIKVSMAKLMENAIISIETNDQGVSRYDLSGLYKKLAVEWEKSLLEKPKYDMALSTTVQKIYPIFEKEFGRPLSPMETSQLIEWCEGDGMDTELILEALKRSVLRGVLNFRYIDSILRQWRKNGIKTAKDVELFEKRIKNDTDQKKTVRRESKKKEPGKYKDLYMNWGG